MRKTALLSAITTALLASAGVQAADAAKAVGAGEGRLDIIAWPGYIERGQSDKAYDWVTPFEKETGCQDNAVHHSRGFRPRLRRRALRPGRARGSIPGRDRRP